ncbi:MAG: nucleoside deaminase [Erysipelotrichia bacterium]|nr:nucleoside deaminase [Erysipelotrichia bacterium]
MERYNKYMELALEEARLAALEDEVPVGCVIVYRDQVIASAHNKRDKSHNPLGHAEILAIKKAGEFIGNWQLVDCELYVTIEPCIMCGGAIIQSRIGKVIYGASDNKGGAFGSSIDILTAKNINHRPTIISGVLEAECSQIIKQYFKNKRIAR